MRLIILLFSALLIISCNSGDEYSLKGNAYGFADGTKVFLFEVDQNNQSSAKDTLEVKNGRFEGSYPNAVDTPLNYIKMEGSDANIVFFVENEDLIAQIYKDSLDASQVLGGKQNELYNSFLITTRKFNKQKEMLGKAFEKARLEQDDIMVNEIRNKNVSLIQEEVSYKRQFVDENSNSIFGLMLLSELFYQEELSADETARIIQQLSPKMSSHPLVIDLKEKIEISKKADIGGVAPNFEAPSPNGKNLSLNEVLGKYTIIDFWASWCRPCRAENPNVVKVYEKYHEKGLNIISVSLDKNGQKDRWIQAIKDDRMNWHHVSNLQFWQDPIARQYNVRSIPATFLLDEQGRIIDKNLRGAALENRIAELLD
jgi:peroxiredoxin